MIDDGDYKEGIFSVSNDKLMLVFGLFSGPSQESDFSKKMSDRMNFIVKELNKKAINNNQIFTMAICQTLGGKIFTSIESEEYTDIIPFAYFDAMELRAISVVESDDLFLPRFMRAKMQLQDHNMLSVVSDFTTATIFSENDLSFYIADDVDYREVNILMGIEENTEYYEKYLQKYNEKTFLSIFDGNWYSSIKEEFSSRHFVKPNSLRNLRCFIETKNNKIIEVVTEQFNSNEDMSVLFNCFDLISYWLDRYYSLVDVHESFGIFIEIDDDIYQYYLAENDLKTDKLADIEKLDNMIVCRISPDLYKSLGKSKTNILEKNLLIQIVKTMDLQFENQIFNTIFSPDYKKKIVGSILDDEGKLRLPTNGFNMLKISEYEINLLLDELGIHLKNEGYDYGPINDSSNSKFSNEIVGFLFSLLESEIKVFDKSMLLKILLTQIETLLPEQLRGEASYNNDIALSVSEKKIFSKQIEDNNRSSLATKFMLEYVVATPLHGEKAVGIWELERLLAICSLILEWAHRSDYFQYNFVKTEITFLKSNRIGLRKKDFEKVDLAMMASRKNQLAVSDMPFFDDSEYSSKTDIILKNKLDKAFIDAFGFSYTNFSLVIGAIVDLHVDKDKIIYIVDKNHLIEKIIDEVESEVGLKEIKLILDSITLSERKKYLTAPIGFSKLDIFPWRFNRRLSFIRRPLIDHEENYMFGIRNIIYAKKYLLRLIWTGRLKTESKLMKDLMSKLRNLEGDRFNSRIMKILESYPNLDVLKGVSKIGKTRILDEKNNTLGDIDVLGINRKTKKIYVIETKDFSFSRNPYEIAMEQEKVFTGDKSFINKHLKRNLWMKNNFPLVKEHFNLSEGKWSFVPMFIVSEHLITRDLTDTNGVLFISMKELNNSLFN